MKKLLSSAILGLCLSAPVVNAAPGLFAIQNTTTIPTDAIDYVLETTMQKIHTSLSSQNAPWILGGALIGLLGFDMVRKSMHTMIDKSLGLKKNENVTYQKLVAKTAIGAGLMGAAGWGLKTILK